MPQQSRAQAVAHCSSVSSSMTFLKFWAIFGAQGPNPGLAQRTSTRPACRPRSMTRSSCWIRPGGFHNNEWRPLLIGLAAGGLSEPAPVARELILSGWYACTRHLRGADTQRPARSTINADSTFLRALLVSALVRSSVMSSDTLSGQRW